MKKCWLICNFDELDVALCEELQNRGYNICVGVMKCKVSSSETMIQHKEQLMSCSNGNTEFYEFELYNESYDKLLEKIKNSDTVTAMIKHINIELENDTIENIDDNAIIYAIDVYVNNTYHCIKRMIPHFIFARTGVVISVNEMSSVKYIPGKAISGILGASSFGFMKSVAKECNRFNVKCLNINVDNSGSRDVHRIVGNICDAIENDYGVSYQEFELA